MAIIWNDKLTTTGKYNVIDTTKVLNLGFKMPINAQTTTPFIAKPMTFEVGEGLTPTQKTIAEQKISTTQAPGTYMKVPFMQKEVTLPQDNISAIIKGIVETPERIFNSLKVLQTGQLPSAEMPTKVPAVKTYQESASDMMQGLLEQGMNPTKASIATILMIGGQMTIDVSWTAGMIESGAAKLTTQFAPALEEKVAAWTLLGKPKTTTELSNSVKTLQHQFHPDLIGVNDASIQINNAYSILKKTGLPTSVDIAKIKVGSLVQKAVGDVGKIFQPVKAVKTLPFKQLPGIAPEYPYQPAFGMSIKKMKPVGEVVPSVKEGIISKELQPLNAISRLGKANNDLMKVSEEAQKLATYVDEKGVTRINGVERVNLEKQLAQEANQEYKLAQNEFYQSLNPKHKIGDIVDYQPRMSPEEIKVFGYKKYPIEKIKITGAEFDTMKSADQMRRTGFPSSFKFTNLLGKNIKTGEEVRLYKSNLVNGELLGDTIKISPEEVLKEFIAKQKLPKLAEGEIPLQAVKGVKEVKPEVEPEVPITPPKLPITITPTTELPKYPEGQYKRELLQEIEQLPVLPKIENDVFNWKPPTLSYQNPITKTLYKVWDKFNDVFTRKAPNVLKTFPTNEIKRLSLEKQRILDGLIQKYTEELIEPLSSLSMEERQKIGQMVFKYIPVETGYVSLIRDIDLHIGQLGKNIVDLDKKLVAQGKLKPDMALLSEDTWFKNLGSYMRTLYVRPPKIPGGETQIIPQRTFSAEGIIDRSAFKRKMTDVDWGLNSLQFEGRSLDEIKDLFNENRQLVEEIGREAKKAWGWRTEADVVLARTFKDMVNTYATRLWQEAVVNSSELFSKTFKTDFISIKKLLGRGVEKDVRLGPLNDGYINPVLEDDIKSMMSFGKDAMDKILGEPLSWWKAFKVAGNPATVARNYLSGAFIQTDMAGYPVWNPKNTGAYVSSVKDYITKSSFYKKLRDGGMYGSDYYSVEIEKSLLKEIEKSTNPAETLGKKLLEKLGDGIKNSKQLFSYYGSIDHLQRTYLAKMAIKDGATISQAVHFANKWELDYRFVPKLIDKMRGPIGGWIMPFISFYSLMAPRILETVATRPWILLKYPIVIAALGYISKQMLGYTDEQTETAKPDFLKNDPYTILTPFKDENGNPVYLNLTYTLPFGGWKTGFIDIPGIGNMIQGMGLVGGIQAIFNNYDSFTQRKIFNDGDLPEDKRKKIGAYILRFVSPGIVSQTLNIWDASQGKVIGWPYPREKDLTQVIARAIGVSTYTGGYNEAITKIRKYDQEIKDIQIALSSILRNVNISSEEKQRKTIEVRKEVEDRIKKIQEIGKSMPPTPTVGNKTQSPTNLKSNVIWK